MKPPPKRSAKIYERAAKILFPRECCIYACWAIEEAKKGNLFAEEGWTCPELEFFEFLFKPHPRKIVWWEKNLMEPRLLALFLAAEITKRGSL